MNYSWRADTTSRFDSLWSLMHKFAYLNGASYEDIKTVFGIPSQFFDPKQYFTNSLGIDKSKVAAVLKISVDNVELTAVSIYDISGGAAVSDSLRYCPICIQRGFHAAAFQNNRIKLCPLHGVKLEQRCPSCHREIPYKPGTRELGVPFGCQCGHVLWSGLYDATWPRSLEQTHERVFEQLNTWVNRIKATSQWARRDISMSGLTCIEPIAGWRPEYFGAIEGGTIEWTYKNTGPISKNKSVIPINVKSVYVDIPASKEIYSWIYHNIFTQCDEHVRDVISFLESIVGTHLKCAKNITVNDTLVGTVNNKSCLFAAALVYWKYQLDSSGWHYSEGQNNGYCDPQLLDSYSHALAVIVGPDANPYQNDNPLLIWLTLHIFRAELLYRFGRCLQWVEEHYNKKMGGNPSISCGTHEIMRPVFAYYPGDRKTAPKFKAYIGVSFDKLLKLAKQGHGCENRKRKKN